MLLSVAVLFRLRRCQPICLLCSFLPWFIPLGRRALCREIHSSSQWNFQEKVDKLFRILAPVFLLGLLLSTLPLRSAQLEGIINEVSLCLLLQKFEQIIVYHLQ